MSWSLYSGTTSVQFSSITDRDTVWLSRTKCQLTAVCQNAQRKVAMMKMETKYRSLNFQSMTVSWRGNSYTLWEEMKGSTSKWLRLQKYAPDTSGHVRLRKTSLVKMNRELELCLLCLNRLEHHHARERIRLHKTSKYLQVKQPIN